MPTDLPDLSPQLGHLELELMEVFWWDSELVYSVNDVLPYLERPLAYTTVMTTLGRLHDKGFLCRDTSGRAFVYRAKVTRKDWRRSLAQSAMAQLLSSGTAASELIGYLVDAIDSLNMLDVLERHVAAKFPQIPAKSQHSTLIGRSSA